MKVLEKIEKQSDESTQNEGSSLHLSTTVTSEELQALHRQLKTLAVSPKALTLVVGPQEEVPLALLQLLISAKKTWSERHATFRLDCSGAPALVKAVEALGMNHFLMD
jgi:hypothetical protein